MKPLLLTSTVRSFASCTALRRMCVAIAIMVLPAVFAFSQCCGDGDSSSGSQSDGDPTDGACDTVKVCFGWHGDTGQETAWPSNQRIVVTMTPPLSLVPQPPQQVSHISAASQGEGSVSVPAGWTVSMAFESGNEWGDPYVVLWECEADCKGARSTGYGTLTVRDTCNSNTQPEGEAEDGIEDTSEATKNKPGSGEDESPFGFSLGLGSTDSGISAGGIDFSPEDLTGNAVSAASLVIRTPNSQSVRKYLSPDNVGTIEVWRPFALQPKLVATIENTITSGAISGFTISCRRPPESAPFVTWRFTKTGVAPVPKVLIEKVVNDLVVSSSQVTKFGSGWTLEKGPKTAAASAAWQRRIEYRKTINPNYTKTFTRKVIRQWDTINGSVVPGSFLLSDVEWTLSSDEEQMLSRRDGAITSTFSYDAEGILESVERSDGSWVKYGKSTEGWSFVQRPTQDLDLQNTTDQTGHIVYSWVDPTTFTFHRRTVVDGQLHSETRSTSQWPDYPEYVDISGGGMAPAVYSATKTLAGTTEVSSSITVSYPTSAPEPNSGRPYRTEQKRDLREVISYYEYALGGFNAGGNFEESPTGPIRRETINEAAPNRAKVFIRYVDVLKNVTVREDQRVFAGAGPSVLISSKKHAYLDGHLISTEQDSGSGYAEIYSATWNGDRLTSETDEEGTVTEYSDFDEYGRSLTTTKAGYGGGGDDAPAQPSTTTTTSYDILGRKVREIVGVGSPAPIVRAWNYDTNSRVTSEVEYGAYSGTSSFSSATYSYANTIDSGQQITESRSGMTIVRSKYRDGTIKSIAGNGPVPETRSYIWALSNQFDPLKKTTVTRGSGTEAVSIHTYTDIRGRVRRTEEPNPTVLNATGLLMREFDYSGYGVVTAERVQGVETVTRDFTWNRLETTRLIATDLGDTVVSFEEDGVEDVAGQKYTFRKTERGKSRRQMTGLGALIAGKGRLSEHSQQLSSPVGAVNGTIISESFTYVDRANKLVRTETFHSGSTIPSIRMTRNGRLESELAVGHYSPKVFAYDALGRQMWVRDPSVWTTTEFGYTAIYLSWMLNPFTPIYKPSSAIVRDFGGAVVSARYYLYDARGNRVYEGRDNALLSGKQYSYNLLLGKLDSQSGDGAYPIEYTYNSLGLIKTMTTHYGPGNADAVTEWNYYPGSTKLASKTDASLHSVSYTYDHFGKLETRTWARLEGGNPVVTQFKYDLLGQLRSITYPDGSGTPNVVWSLPDAFGRYTKITDGVGARTIVRTPQAGGGENVVESVTPPAESPETYVATEMTIARDVYGRLTDIDATAGAASLLEQSFSYGDDGRLQGTAESNTGLATVYWRSSNSNFVVHTLTYEGTMAEALANTQSNLRKYFDRYRDNEGRVGWVQNWHVGENPALTGWHSFGYDAQDRRISESRDYGTTVWDYGYNNRNEVTSASRKNAEGTPLNGWQFSYNFDAIGNRLSSSGPRTGSYTPNALNQYTEATVQGKVDVVGEVSTPNTTVYVRRTEPDPEQPKQAVVEATRQGAWFHRQILASNASPVGTHIGVQGIRRGENGGPDQILPEEVGHTLVPKAAETFAYDDDGNMTADSLWTYSWDAENRLTSVVSTLPPASPGYREVSYSYDYGNRMVRKAGKYWKPVPTVDGQGNTSYTWEWQEYRRYFVWHGWNIIAELEEIKPAGDDFSGTATLLRRNVWGLDLSGSLQGAGGVGGLLAVQNVGGTTPQTTTPVYDGNGNILAYHTLTTGVKVADFAYGPFGEPLKAYGPAAKNHPFRFSTKYTDEETGLVLYQLRPYRPNLGRWLQRDRIGERGGVNLYGIVGNNPIRHWDYLGMVGAGSYGPVIPSGPSANTLLNDDINENHTWHHTRQEVGIELCGCSQDDIRRETKQSLRQFTEFNSSANPHATVRLDGNMAFFDLSDPMADFANSPEIGVTLSGNGEEFAQQATTNEMHPLIGMRQWGVVILPGSGEMCFMLVVWTEAIETTNNLNWMAEQKGRNIAMDMWAGYIERVATTAAEKCCTDPNDNIKAKTVIDRETNEIPHPWQ